MKFRDLKHGDVIGDNSMVWICIRVGSKMYLPNLYITGRKVTTSVLHEVDEGDWDTEYPYIVISSVSDVLHKIIKGEYESR